MIINADRLILLKAAKAAAESAAAINSTLPELSGLLIEADMDNNVLRLTGSNSETCIQTRVRDVKIEQEGSAVIGAVMLCEMLKLLNGEVVNIETDTGGHTCVKSGNACYTVMSLNPEKFPKPDIPFPEESVQITRLPKLIKQTLFAAADNPSNPALQGVRLTFSKDNTNLAATDSLRLAVAESDNCADGDLEAVLHQKSLRVLNNVIGANDTLFAGIANKSLVLFNENILFCARLLNHPFPDINRMLESVEKVSGCICDAKELLSAVDAILTVARYSLDRYVHLVINDTGLRLHTAGDVGSTAQRVAAEDILPTPPEGFYYSPNMMMDFLQLAKGDVELSISKQGFMLLNTGGYKYLLVPRTKPKPKVKKEEKKKSKALKNKKSEDTAQAA